jgi:hypothetical protein
MGVNLTDQEIERLINQQQQNAVKFIIYCRKIKYLSIVQTYDSHLLYKNDSSHGYNKMLRQQITRSKRSQNNQYV